MSFDEKNHNSNFEADFFQNWLRLHSSQFDEFLLHPKIYVKMLWSVLKGNFRYKIVRFGQNDTDFWIPGSLNYKIATLEVHFDAPKALQEGMK